MSTITKKIEQTLGKEVLGKLDQIMFLSPGNDDHADIIWLYNWLTEPGRTYETYEFILTHAGWKHDMLFGWERRSFERKGGNTIYLARVVAEALAAMSPVLDRGWDYVAWKLIKLFEKYPVSKYMNYGPISTRLSDWLISIAGDPDMCPEPSTRLDILVSYEKYVRFDRDNHDEALTAIMLALSSIERIEEEHYGPARSKDFVDHLLLFKKDSVINIGLRLAEKLRYNRSLRVKNLLHDNSQAYCIGLKTINHPWELKTLIALLKYTRDSARIVYKTFQDELAKEESEQSESDEDEYYVSNFYDEKPNHVTNVNISLDRLFFLVRMFKTALQEPELLNDTVDCIMDVLEAYIKIVWVKEDVAKTFCLLSINSMLYEFCTLAKDEDKDKDADKDEDENENIDEGKDEDNSDDDEDDDDSEEDDSEDDDEEIEVQPTIEQTPVGQEIIRKYKKRICDLRLLVTKEILFNGLFSNKYLHDILFNNQN